MDRSIPETRAEQVEMFLLLFAARFVTIGIVAVLGSLVASLYYTDLKGIDFSEQVMATRPNAPGSAKAILAEHGDHCWTDGKPRGVVTGALVRSHPNDSFLYVTNSRADTPTLIRALEQALEGKERGLDTVLAFCTDPPPTKEHT